MVDGQEIRSQDSLYLFQPTSVDLNNLTNSPTNDRSVQTGPDLLGSINSDNSSSSDNSIDSSSNSIGVISERGESSTLAAVFLLVNAAMGAGLLNFPQAFDQAGGIWAAVLVQLVLVCCICFGLLVLAHTSWRVHAATLQDTMAGTCGPKGSLLCSLLIALYCFGSCITLLIIIGDQFDRVLMSLVGPSFCHLWYMDRHFTIAASAVVFVLSMCFSKKIDFLKYISSLGVAAGLYVVGLVVFQYYVGDFVPGPIKTTPSHWTDVFFVVPVICFGYQCHVSVVPIYACVNDRRLSSFTIVIITTLAVCASAYTLIGVYGYLTFGSYVSSDILENYGGADVSVLVGIAAIAVKSVTTYPILLFCGREAVRNVWCGMTCDWDPCREKRRRVIISLTWFLATVVLAVISPDIGIVIDALGSLAAVFIFVLPGVCLLQTCLQRDPFLLFLKWHVLVAILFAATGAFLLGVVLTQTLQRLLAGPYSRTYLCT